MMPIEFPWPDKALSPNARVHWAVRSDASRVAREMGHYTAIAGGWHRAELPPGRLHLWITFHPPTRRMPDDDNMLARVKPYRDGIADAMRINDRRFVSHPFVSEKTAAGGSVVMRITFNAEGKGK